MNLKELTSKTFCISYDLRGDDCDYTSLENKLIELNGKRILQSVWIIELNDNQSCKRLENDLSKHIDKTKDGLLVARIFGTFRITNSL